MKKLTTIRYDPVTMQFSTPRKVSKTKEELLREGAEITKKLIKFNQFPGYTVYHGERHYITDDGKIANQCTGGLYQSYFHYKYDFKGLPIEVLERIVRNGKRRLTLPSTKVWGFSGF